MVGKMIIDTNRKVNFGIFKWSKSTNYGYRTHGEYRTNNIDIYYDKQDKTKLYYVSDILKNWLKSKLTYFDKKGNKRVTTSENGRL
jgi:hypothetical protein